VKELEVQEEQRRKRKLTNRVSRGGDLLYKGLIDVVFGSRVVKFRGSEKPAEEFVDVLEM
jgi:hypothetical protein